MIYEAVEVAFPVALIVTIEPPEFCQVATPVASEVKTLPAPALEGIVTVPLNVAAPVVVNELSVVAPAERVEEKVPAAAFKFPVKLKEVPVAAPIAGLTSVGLFDRTTLPVPVDVVTPVPPLTTAIVVPLQVPAVMVPTLVKLEPVTVDFNVVPDNVPASAIILADPAVVNLPLVSTVNVGIAIVDPYDPAITPLLLNVVAKEPEPVPVTSPVKVVVAVADITSVPITNPKFDLAAAAVVAPVPPFAIAMTVPLHVPLVIVPTEAISAPTNLLAAIEPDKSAFVIAPVKFNFEYAIAALEETSASEIVDLVAIVPSPKFVLAPEAVVDPVPPFAIGKLPLTLLVRFTELNKSVHLTAEETD
jgi:hypothetical protein